MFSATLAVNRIFQKKPDILASKRAGLTGKTTSLKRFLDGTQKEDFQASGKGGFSQKLSDFRQVLRWRYLI